MTDNSTFPKWDNANPMESLKLVYLWAVAKAQEQIAWYDRKKRSKRGASQTLRALTIVFASAGALCPLIDATGVFEAGNGGVAFGRWGYVLLALGGALHGFDRFFGMSSGWMRFIVTQMSIERALKEFEYDWALLFAQQAQNPNVPAMLQRVKEFTLQVETLVKEETDAWVVEFRSNLTELEKVLKAEADTRKLGSIKMKVTNAGEFPKVAILLNDNPVKELLGTSEGLIDNVPPRRYEIRATAEKDGRNYRESKVVEVQPNSMSSIELTLR